jgi:hypothetical protein
MGNDVTRRTRRILATELWPWLDKACSKVYLELHETMFHEAVPKHVWYASVPEIGDRRQDDGSMGFARTADVTIRYSPFGML